MKVRLHVTRWNALVEPDPNRDEYAGYDGRVLFLNAQLTYPKMAPEVEAAPWEVGLAPCVDETAKKNNACGLLSWFRSGGLNFRAKVGLSRLLWDDLWRRSAAPPPNCDVWLDVDWGDDFGADASDVPVREPIIHMSSK
jgi:hypothetical protein